MGGFSWHVSAPTRNGCISGTHATYTVIFLAVRSGRGVLSFAFFVCLARARAHGASLSRVLGDPWVAFGDTPGGLAVFSETLRDDAVPTCFAVSPNEIAFGGDS